MDQQDQRLVNQSILQRLQMQEMQKRILQSVAGNMGVGRFANPNMAPNQPPPGPITGGASTFPKTVPPPVPPFNTQTTPFIPPQPQQNPPLGGSIPPGGVMPQLPGAMPLNQSIIPKTTPGMGGSPVMDPRTETMYRGQQLANNLPKPPVNLPQVPNTPPRTRSIEEIMQMLKGGDRTMQGWWTNPSG